MQRGISVHIRLFGGDDDLLAFADVTVRVQFGQITIRRFKVLDGEDGKPRVVFPQAQYMQLLSVKYVELLHLNQRVSEYIRNSILKAYFHEIALRKQR